MKELTGIHHVADLVITVANELLISTEAAMEEAESIDQLLRKEFFKKINLDGAHYSYQQREREGPGS